MSKEEFGEELPKPIGNFIIENAIGIIGNDGMYYHYSEVCKLLRLYEKELKEKFDNMKK